MAIYFGNNYGRPVKVKEVYFGNKNGRPQKVKEVYFGDNNGRPRLAYRLEETTTETTGQESQT